MTDKEHAIAVPGSAWSCTYRRLFDAQPAKDDPRSAPSAIRLHALDCTVGAYTAGLSLQCPIKVSDLMRELELGRRQRLAEVLILIEQTPTGERRNFVTLACEP